MVNIDMGFMHVKHFTHSWAISMGITHSVHPFPLFHWVGLAGSQFLDGDCWVRCGDFFQRWLQFLHIKIN